MSPSLRFQKILTEMESDTSQSILGSYPEWFQDADKKFIFLIFCYWDICKNQRAYWV